MSILYSIVQGLAATANAQVQKAKRQAKMFDSLSQTQDDGIIVPPYHRYVCGLGECLYDVYGDDDRRLGGAPTNFAFHVNQLLKGYTVCAVSAVGNEEDWGLEAIRKLRESGLKTIITPMCERETGKVYITMTEDKIPQYNIAEGAWDYIPYFNEMDYYAKKTYAVCFGTLAQRNEVSRNTINRFLDATPEFCMRIFDINLRQDFYSKEIIEGSFQRCNVLKLNNDELPLVCRLFGIDGATPEKCCRKIMSLWEIGTVIYTCGAKGSYIFTTNETSYKDTTKVDAIDTVGAGDSFTAAFCAASLMGLPIDEAHRLAVDVSAYVCTQHGAMPLLPNELKIV